MSRAVDFLSRYETALARHAAVAILVALAAIAYVLVTMRKNSLPVPRWAPAAVLVLISILGVIWAWQLRWLSDDAFISFRYARNWVEGHGLVFNIGERVEGYTNFLWMAILAFAYLIGLDIPTVAVVLCLASHVGVLVLTTRLVRRLAPEGRPVLVSLAAVTLAASYLSASYATSGLETSFGALLVLAAVDRAHAGRALAAGAIGIAATMAHPDHAIFYVSLGVVLLIRRTPRRALVLYAAPFVLVFVPYFLWRWSYYGLPLPNTYYAKSGGSSYFSQGGLYLFASAAAAGLLGVLPLAGYGVMRRFRELPTQLTCIAVPVYLVYVAKIGGDFMLGRLLVPVLPLILIHAEVGARTLIAERRAPIAGVALVVASLACVSTRVLGRQEVWHGITDERTFYRVATLRPLALRGSIGRRVELLKRYFSGRQPPPKYAAHAIGILGWTTDWPIVDIHGLIDPELAQEPLAKRGRPGHERTASAAHIIKRGADISATNVYDERYLQVTTLVLDGETYHLTRYRADLLDPLRGDSTVSFVRFPERIDTYLAAIDRKATDAVARDLAFFDRYYFAGNPDPGRRGQLAAIAGVAE